MLVKRICISIFCIVLSLGAEQGHEFSGKHFLASYLDCDSKAICDLQALMEAMDEAVALSGAKVLEKSSYVFTPHGLTLVYLLSESHASLHTYPEFGSCFVDLFTCGPKCSSTAFDLFLRSYLKPKEVHVRTFLRNDHIVEIPNYTIRNK